MATPRRRRADGEASRQRILDAAAAIAGERGYEGTSIALVEARSGLPASSIYWHFGDKDGLIAAVIERSFQRWLAGAGAWEPPAAGASRSERLASMLRATAQSLLEAPDFLRLGLMLVLERRAEEPSARRIFLQVREETRRRSVASFSRLFPELNEAGARSLARLTMAMADGLFIAREVEGDGLSLVEAFEALVPALLAAAEQLASRAEYSSKAAS